MLKRFLIVFLPVALILGGILAAYYYIEAGKEVDLLEVQARESVDSRLEIIINDFDEIVDDLIFLSEQNELIQFLDTDDASWKDDIAEEYLALSTSKQIYDQIRFIDDTGMEVVRVNYKMVLRESCLMLNFH